MRMKYGVLLIVCAKCLKK